MDHVGGVSYRARVSTKFVFLFVLFAPCWTSWSGNYFIKMAFGALGHLKVPGQAAVCALQPPPHFRLAIANVVTTAHSPFR
ncbi:hypothetical protein [Roseibium aggregatum]|uniref:hypothetical protein n=1 Tax=Roseibium aggregatum TaxID=187304 RepID=UPI001E481FB2|nr:hypothetical protein [Roseibium aggregatum]